ncbi:MAG: LamB/YcsF family protein [Verrucomicrobia bacterium]|nr:MAG: LamB/YcsF family protein [Verrucomicrobiota bacterium]PYK71748.1 MAG: LamB/YcsF family protein [Verrucomicrobiota bacterium]
MKVDLNSDLGEGAGHDDEILSLVSSANIACGFHAGNPASIFNSISAAKEKGVAVGAHPSLDDRKNFGRTEMQLSAAEAYALVAYQVGAFHGLCAAAGVEMNHVKPHGALYNMAVRNRELSDAIAHGVLAVNARAILFAPAGTELFRAAQELGLQTAAEVFADRNYNSDGTLVSRTEPDALLHDPAAAAERVVRMLMEGKIRAVDGSDVSVKAETICLHGDKPDAVEFARTLRAHLEREGIILAAPEKS